MNDNSCNNIVCLIHTNQLTLWLMEYVGSMLSSKPKQFNSSIDAYFFKVHSNIALQTTPRSSLKALMLYSILARCPAYHNLIDLITLPILYERCKL